MLVVSRSLGIFPFVLIAIVKIPLPYEIHFIVNIHEQRMLFDTVQNFILFKFNLI